MLPLFITGTDTGIGKTTAAVALLQQLNLEGFKTFGIKPLASGCVLDARGRWVNEDALALQKVASLKRAYEVVNPIALEEPIAPHLAAKKTETYLSVEFLMQHLSVSIQSEADVNIIEGVGGWSVPLNDHELFSDLVAALHMPTILVVAIKLGCLNHALLTQQSILEKKVPFVGWVANCIEPDARVSFGNIKTLETWLKAPLLGILPYGFFSDKRYEDHFPLSRASRFLALNP